MKTWLRRWLGVERLEERVANTLEDVDGVITRCQQRWEDGIDGRILRADLRDEQYRKDDTYNAALGAALVRPNISPDQAHRIAVQAVRRRHEMPQEHEEP